MDIGMIYERTKEHEIIVREAAKFGVTKRNIAARLGIGETALDAHYGDMMRAEKVSLHAEMGNLLYNLAKQTDDLNVALKSATTIITKICRVEQPDPADATQSTLGDLKRVVDALVAIKEQEHDC